MDFHFGAGNLMEKIRGAPRVHKLAVAIDVSAGLRVDEVNVLGVVAAQLAGDFRVGAHGVSAKHFAILADGPLDILQGRFRPHLRERSWIWNEFACLGRRTFWWRLDWRRNGCCRIRACARSGYGDRNR